MSNGRIMLPSHDPRNCNSNGHVEKGVSDSTCVCGRPYSALSLDFHWVFPEGWNNAFLELKIDANWNTSMRLDRISLPKNRHISTSTVASRLYWHLFRKMTYLYVNKEFHSIFCFRQLVPLLDHNVLISVLTIYWSEFYYFLLNSRIENKLQQFFISYSMQMH